MWRRLASGVRASHASGSLYLRLGAASAVGAAVLYASAELEASQRRELQREFAAMLDSERVKANTAAAEAARGLRGLPTMWAGVITETYPGGLSGPKMLPGAREGLAVEVLVEDVGDEGKYLSVRDPATGYTGMYLGRWVRRREPA